MSILIITDEYTNCLVCVDECPEEAIVEKDICVIDTDFCTKCLECMTVCPVDCIVETDEDGL